MSEQQTASILAVCVDESTATVVSDGESFLTASSARQAIDLLRMLKFDLLITGTPLPDMPVFSFISKIKAAWPWQKWALVASDLSPQDEVIARTLGVIRIFDQHIELEAMAQLGDHVRHRGRLELHAEPKRTAKAS